MIKLKICAHSKSIESSDVEYEVKKDEDGEENVWKDELGEGKFGMHELREYCVCGDDCDEVCLLCLDEDVFVESV